MFKISEFILKWLFLNNLIDTQNTNNIFLELPQQIPTTPQQQQNYHEILHHAQEQPVPQKTEWKKLYLKNILLYPSIPTRLLALNAIRLNLVYELSHHLTQADESIQQYKYNLHHSKNSNVYSNDPFVNDALTKILKANDDETSLERYKNAIELHKELHDNLPQILSIILHSNTISTNQHTTTDPIAILKSILIQKCQNDPNLGIELCWLLEATVGRNWKTLLEHRKLYNRRLIVILPADKAKILASIGMEKKVAFELLQDVEQATAYGMSGKSLLPKGLGRLRCSHYGDTMHFIDLLSSLSRQLVAIPIVQRNSIFKESLSQLNRRIRRRIMTKGHVNLDIDDHLNADDWPTLDHVVTTNLHYSIHFPLIPYKQSWPGGDDHPSFIEQQDVFLNNMRILNIIVSDCRLLSSRERCPILIHVEIVETGCDGYDARLYDDAIGMTMEEVIGALAGCKVDIDSLDDTRLYRIPSELLWNYDEEPNTQNKATDVRGGEDYWGYYNDDMNQPVSYTEESIIDDTGSYEGATTHEVYEDGHDIYNNDYISYEDTSTQYESWREYEIARLHEEMQQRHQPPKKRLLMSTALLNKVYGPKWSFKCREIRNSSPFGKLKGWRLASFILKAGEDIRKESLVMQIIIKLNHWFINEIEDTKRPYLRPYSIMCVGDDAGLIECLTDCKSVDEIKKEVDGFTTLRDYFERAYVGASDDTIGFEEAQLNFLKSLVGYSLICYILQIKDRHNANILLDREGHLYHIDFGFVLGETPKMGKVPIFSERAPFKLTQEFWDVIGGWDYQNGGLGVQFCRMLETAFEVASRHSNEIASFIEAFLLKSNNSEVKEIVQGVKARLRMRGASGSKEQKLFIMDLVNGALTSWGTSTYDWLQKNMNGYV